MAVERGRFITAIAMEWSNVTHSQIMEAVQGRMEYIYCNKKLRFDAIIPIHKYHRMSCPYQNTWYSRQPVLLYWAHIQKNVEKNFAHDKI